MQNLKISTRGQFNEGMLIGKTGCGTELSLLVNIGITGCWINHTANIGRDFVELHKFAGPRWGFRKLSGKLKSERVEKTLMMSIGLMTYVITSI
jgi:hypothetical protein